jgi:hypothetical protein
MRRSAVVTFAALLVFAACGGSTATIGAPEDAGAGGAPGPSGGDGGSRGDAALGDGAADASRDAPDDVTACSACQPDFCGCGQCTADQVVCTKTPKPCPLGCATACDLSAYKCACDADRCVRTAPAPSMVIACYTTLDCPPGNCCMPRSGLLQGGCVAGNACP